jgi:hypothetical protein
LPSTVEYTRSDFVEPTQLRFILALAYLAVISAGLLIALLGIIWRYFQYSRARLTPPRLLERDLVMIIGLVMPILLISAARSLPISQTVNLSTNAMWIIVTSTPPVIGIWYWVYYEFFKIEKRSK